MAQTRNCILRVSLAVGFGAALLCGTWFFLGPWTDWLLEPMGWFHDHIFLAVIVALVFGISAMPSLPTRRGVARDGGIGWTLLGCAVVWAAYAVYEWTMHLWERTVVAPIRVDLALLAPVLYLAAGIGILSACSRLSRRLLARKPGRGLRPL